MEAASKNRSKKRGRPRVWSEEARALALYVSPSVKTDRSLNNTAYRQLAVTCLVDDPAFSWLCDKEKMEAGASNAWKPGILSELGRFRERETIRAYAARICELKPGTKEAIIILRRARIERAPSVNYRTLVTMLCRAVDDYRASRPDCEREMVLRALADVAEIVRGR